MEEYGLSKIAVLVEKIENGIVRNLIHFENANITLSGDYLIITEHKEDKSRISKVMNLSDIHSYKITNNNE
jgi:hypothetical protein